MENLQTTKNLILKNYQFENCDLNLDFEMYNTPFYTLNELTKTFEIEEFDFEDNYLLIYTPNKLLKFEINNDYKMLITDFLTK